MRSLDSPISSSLLPRRTLLRATALAALSPWLGSPLLARAAGVAADSTAALRPAGVPLGKPGEFKFLDGEWRIAHRWRSGPDSKEWLTFPGEATCHSILDGRGSVEDLRIPQRKFHGMGLRLLEAEKQVWCDYWVNIKSGVLTTPGTYGGFADGVGTFESQDEVGDPPPRARGVWDRITGHSHRWTQAISNDGGKTWQETWLMEWTKV